MAFNMWPYQEAEDWEGLKRDLIGYYWNGGVTTQEEMTALVYRMGGDYCQIVDVDPASIDPCSLTEVELATEWIVDRLVYEWISQDY